MTSTLLRLTLLQLLMATAVAPALSQTQGVDILLGKARSLEARGRIDLAAQNWRQVLLADPKQTEALAGLSRYAKENGNIEEEHGYLDRLRKINPSDPAIAATETMKVVTPEERSRLEEAGRLNMQGKADEAMKIYHSVFAEEPPPGKWAEAYYEAETASNAERQKAIAQLHSLCSRNPKNEVYRLWLARALSYEPKTRAEAFRLLESIKDPGAVEQAKPAWRQALLWEKDNPDVEAPLEAYLARYPDPELQEVLIPLRERQRREAANSDEKHGYEALHIGQLAVAETQFQQALQNTPKDAGAIAGLGFIRLAQKRFDEALRLFDQARALAPQRADIQEGYENARFLGIMNQASLALERDQPDAAIATYRQALALRPADPQALLGLGQVYMRQKKLSEAKAQFQQVLSGSNNNVDAMAGLGLICLQERDFPQALRWLEQVQRLAPDRTDIRAAYEASKYAGTMQQGGDALKQKNSDDALAAYQQAAALRPGTKDPIIGLAQASEEKRDYAGAAQYYARLTAVDPDDAQGWLGLVRVQLKGHNVQAALNTTRQIPPQTRQKVEARSDYWSQLALLHYQANQANEGDTALRRALDLATHSDSAEAVDSRLQVANTLMEEGRTLSAEAVYKQVTESHPDNSGAWEGLIGAYARLKDFTGAGAALSAMPQSARTVSMENVGFLNATASIYSAQGRCSEAEDLLNRAVDLNQASGHRPPIDTEMQLSDLWMRERNYLKAAGKYHEILQTNSGRSDVWRGYFTALHAAGQNGRASTEIDTIPPAVRAELEDDPHFLSLLANIELADNRSPQAAQLLERARSRYAAIGQTSPPDLDVQLAWLLLDTRGDQAELAGLLSQAIGRKDLTTKQRDAIHSIWATWSVRRAAEALENNQFKNGETILLETARVFPGDPHLRAELSFAYMAQHQNQKALDVYLTWGMAGAEVTDYRAAAGAALAAHKDPIADQFIQEGLERWPRDPELLRMSAKEAAKAGNYDQAEHELKLALASMRSGTPNETDRHANATPSTRLPNPGPVSDASTSETTLAGCRPDNRSAKTDNATIQPIAAVWKEPSDFDDPDDSQDEVVNPKKEQETQDEIDIVQNRNTPFVALDNLTGGRTGDPGFNQLFIEDGALGNSVTINNRVRIGFEAGGVYLFSGTPSGSSTRLFGTLPPGAVFGEQSALGYAAQVQLSTNDVGLMFGTSPQGFPIHNLLGGARFRPGHGPITFLFVRDNIKDSLLSYAGVRDPGTGTVWGGVISNAGSIQFKRDTRRKGVYATARYSDIRGQNVPDNYSVDGNAGFYVNVVQKPLFGVSVGLNVGGAHYAKNLNFFSLGQGGYFSPQQYYQASIPLSVSGRHNRFEYELAVAGGVQHFTEDSSLFYPTLTFPTLQQSAYPGDVQTEPNYSATFRMNYRVTDHTNFGFFATANNSRNYATQAIGFSLKFLFHRVPTNPDLQVRSIPDWKGVPPMDLH